MRDAITVIRANDVEFRPMCPTSSDKVLIFYHKKDLAIRVDAAMKKLKSDGLIPQESIALCCESEMMGDIALRTRSCIRGGVALDDAFVGAKVNGA